MERVSIPKPTKQEKKPRKPIKRRKKDERTKLSEECDKLWGKVAKLLWKGVCATCGKPANQPHHFFGKKAYPNLRHDPNNVVLLCFYCHLRGVHDMGDTKPARDALIRRIGAEAFEALRTRAYSPTQKVGVHDLEDTRELLQGILSRSP